MSSQIVTHETHPVKRLSNCHRGCGRACVPTMLFNDFKTELNQEDTIAKRTDWDFVAVCIMVAFVSALLLGCLSH